MYFDQNVQIFIQKAFLFIYLFIYCHFRLYMESMLTLYSCRINALQSTIEWLIECFEFKQWKTDACVSKTDKKPRCFQTFDRYCMMTTYVFPKRFKHLIHLTHPLGPLRCLISFHVPLPRQALVSCRGNKASDWNLTGGIIMEKMMEQDARRRGGMGSWKLK